MAYSGQVANAAREVTVTETIQARLAGVTEQAVALRQRLGSLRDRALGSEPSKAEAVGAPKPVPNGKLSEIDQYIGDLGRLIEECHQHAAQLDRIA